MLDRLIALVLDEGKWPAAAMVISLAAVLWLLPRQRHRDLPARLDVLWAMSLFFGGVVGIMAAGHLLAVTIKLLQGTLDGSPWILYPLGVVLAVPAAWLVVGIGRFVGDEERYRSRIVALNGALAAALLAMGLHNLPIALPGMLNVAYVYYPTRVLGRAIVTVAVVGNLAMLVGSIVFAASGQSFEQFGGM